MENIIAEAGDLIESRNPELVTPAPPFGAMPTKQHDKRNDVHGADELSNATARVPKDKRAQCLKRGELPVQL